MDPVRSFSRQDVNVTSELSRETIISKIPVLSLKTKTSLIKSKNYLYNKTITETVPSDIEDPFLNIDINPFSNLSAYDLASIDMFFNITGHNSGVLAPQLLKFQNYIISGTQDQGFIEYIQYRNMISFVYFFESLKLKGNLMPDRINQIKNYDKFRYLNIDYYINKVKNVDISGIDVYVVQDYKSDMELLYQVIMMTSTLKENGHGIIKIELSDFTIDLFSILSNCFDNVSLFKPATIGLYNNTFYIIGRFYKKNKSNEIIRFLRDFIKRGSYLDTIDRILQERDKQINEYIDGIIELLVSERAINVNYIPEKIKMYLNIST